MFIRDVQIEIPQATMDSWQEVVDIVVNSIKKRKQAEGICRAVLRCGELIREHFPIKKDDTDELGNLIIED